MSRKTVEIVARGFQAYARGDFEALREVLHPEVEWKQVEEPSAVYGREAALAAIVRWDEAWDDADFSVEEMVDAGEDVVVLLRQRGRGKVSGIPVQHLSWHVFTVRDELVVRMYEHGPGTRVEALEAMGLAE